MVKLKDYLGTLISGVNQARVMADIESAKIAQAYANDDILKHFPVPRFRAQDVELDIPIAIDGFDEQPIKNYQPLNNKTFNSHTYASMKDIAKVASFSRTTSKELSTKIAENSRALETDLKADIAKDVAFKKYEEKMGTLFIKALERDNIEIENQDEVKESYQRTLKEKLYNSVTPKRASNLLENAKVVVEATKLKEIPNENIVRIKMKLFEDGMEWHTQEDANGTIKASLLPE